MWDDGGTTYANTTSGTTSTWESYGEWAYATQARPVRSFYESVEPEPKRPILADHKQREKTMWLARARQDNLYIQQRFRSDRQALRPKQHTDRRRRK